jgi:hypothetical protein
MTLTPFRQLPLRAGALPGSAPARTPGARGSAGGRLSLAVVATAVLMAGAAASSGAEPPEPAAPEARAALRTGTTLSFDGDGWTTAPDPGNEGRERSWYLGPRPESKPTRVPWTFLADYKNYHGVMWYWHAFEAPPNPLPHGRTLVRFWAVDYKADVWVNGAYVGGHEGAETPFTLDITHAVKPGGGNVIAVRVVNPDATPIDGLVLAQVPHRNKADRFPAGDPYNYGGILDSVDLLVVPDIRIDDLFARPDPGTGRIRVQWDLSDAGPAATGQLEVTVSEDATGAVVSYAAKAVTLNPGANTLETDVTVTSPRLWSLDDPHLYRITARVARRGGDTFDQHSTRIGFREFRLRDGSFELNGKRLFLESTFTGDGAPIGYVIPPPSDPDLLRRDLIYAKTMGFNTMRFICGMPTRAQVELCDEIGMLVYEESYASWLLEDSPKMGERFDRSISEMIRRDRNHPSVVIWGLLNETPAWGRKDGKQSTIFDHAARTLPWVRSLDETRLILLNSGRFDGHLDVGSVSNPGSQTWEYLLGAEAPDAGQTQPDTSVCNAYYKGAGDVHIYPPLPHSEAVIQFLRTVGQGTKPVFISEYGYAPALDLSLIARHYEQLDQEDYSSAYYRSGLDRFMKDWDRWGMAACFGRPEDYFRACVAAQTEVRSLGLNAIRSNPNLVGYDLTSLVDGYAGEGLVTYFHELKPGMVDAISDGLAPLRWCLFAGPPDVYRGGTVKLEAVLADEDVLLPGRYQARLEVFGPAAARVLDRTATFDIPAPGKGPRLPFAFRVFAEDVAADWPEGTYRFVATLAHGGVAAGGEAAFSVTDARAMRPVEAQVALWGDDPVLARWLTQHQIPFHPFSPADAETNSGVILAGKAAPPGGPAAWEGLIQAVKRGSTALFLDPGLFKEGAGSVDPASLGIKGKLITLPNLILIADYWAKRHPIFDGLPSGGLMDYGYYRDILSNVAWKRDDAPSEAVAGGIVSSPMYASGLSISVDALGSGRIILNTLKIEANLGSDPAAERLLRNMLRYAATR